MDKIKQWMEHAPDEGADFCTLERYRYMAKVRVYLAMGKTEKAFRLLSRILVYAQKRERTWLVMETKILLAITQYRMNDGKWKDTLQEAVTQAEDYHFVRILTREGAAIRDLLKTGSLTWTNKNFQKQVRRECDQMAAYYPAYLDEEQAGVIRLSGKAMEILRLQAQGKTLQQISQELGLSKEGVRYYNRSTYRKLGAGSKTEALIKAKDKGIL